MVIIVFEFLVVYKNDVLIFFFESILDIRPVMCGMNGNNFV